MKKNIIVIGAGPSGLAISSLLEKENQNYIVLEKEKTYGGVYSHVDSEINLLSPMSFNYLPLSKTNINKEMVNVGEYLNYLEEYVQKQNFNIKYNSNIQKVEYVNRQYNIYTSNNEKYECEKLILATGMFNFPKELNFNREENPDILYKKSSEVFLNDDYEDKNILIIGSGTSAVEISTRLAKKSKIYLSINKNFKVFPLFIKGINIHYFVKYIEKIPVKYSKTFCEGKWSHPGFDRGFNDALKSKKITLLYKSDYELKNNYLCMSNGKKIKIDILINSIGYNFDSGILPKDVLRRKNGIVYTKNNESVSHKNLFVMGHPCVGGLDSPFLRGIKKDAYRIMDKIKVS